MVALLDAACQQLSDPPDEPRLSVAEWTTSGGPGRPRMEIDPQFLAFAVNTRGPERISQVLGCSARTVRRRILEHAILPPGESPCQDVILNNNQTARICVGNTRNTRMSNISDDDLDQQMIHILTQFPNYGRRMIDGRLKAMGFNVSQTRISSSYRRVHGPPRNWSENRRIRRRQYTVAGVNSVWHQDGQHGL